MSKKGLKLHEPELVYYISARWTECISAMFRSECDIRESFDTNECPNIFISTKLDEWISEYIHTNFFDTNECPNKYSYWKLHEYSNIFEYSSRFYTLTHSPTNVRIYSYKQIWHERMSEYIRKRKIDTNECPNIYSWPIYSNIRIFEYIRHTLVWNNYSSTFPFQATSPWWCRSCWWCWHRPRRPTRSTSIASPPRSISSHFFTHRGNQLCLEWIPSSSK